MILLIVVIIILVSIVVALIVYNISLYRRIKIYKNKDKRFANLSILQNFMSIIGNELNVDKKIKAMNDIMIEKYQIKYSTIVVFDGTDFVVKASNVNSTHWDALRKLHEINIFSDSITTAIPKYITVDGDGEKLPYQEKEFDRAKSAIFFPLYIDNVYIGYWIIESGKPHDFDNIDTSVFETIKDNLISCLKAVDYQKTLENIVRKDLFTGLNSAEYLYGEGKKIIDQYTKSAICMFRISNIEKINHISRELGNKVISEVSKNVKNSISEKYIFVRYMGPKFVIVFAGVELEDVKDFIREIKESTENLEIELDNNFKVEDLEVNRTKKARRKKEEENVKVSPILNFVIAKYYKGTGIVEVLKKMEKHLDDASKEESSINSI